MRGIEIVHGYQEDIIETIPSTILIVDRGREVLYANRNFYLKSGKKEKDVIGIRLSKIFSPVLMQKLDKKIQEVFSTAEPFEGEQIRYPGGRFYFYRIYPLREAGGAVSKAVIFMEDITEMTRLEEELRDSYIKLENAYAELKELDGIKSEFVSMVSHELRTPLTVINSYLEMFEDGLLGDLSDLQKEKIQLIRSQTDTMIQLVDDMLDSLRIGARRLRLKKELTDIEDMICSVIASLSRLADLREHVISFRCEMADARIECDPKRIIQVLSNLLTNAIKYTPERGRIDVVLKEENGYALVSVRDNGIGIREEDRDRVFDKFFVGMEESRADMGMGLGLSIAKDIVEAHGGRIWFESRVGEGSTFYFTLPRGGHPEHT
ncbi:MAG: ATP-binding protein [Methanothrix sp.]|uniref:PAS domain-containing sensor histidine kinase n=1 Tax=Methanothrix sp. TaxID=90426 RepID=UPI0025ED0F7B|nr:ATP-binding protein [Methanothrix sp.]MCQ8902520.1 ATP-binding protein [Methanothrix sp.]